MHLWGRVISLFVGLGVCRAAVVESGPRTEEVKKLWEEVKTCVVPGAERNWYNSALFAKFEETKRADNCVEMERILNYTKRLVEDKKKGAQWHLQEKLLKTGGALVVAGALAGVGTVVSGFLAKTREERKEQK